MLAYGYAFSVPICASCCTIVRYGNKQVNEIERRYGESITKLMNRVDSLESRGNGSSPVPPPRNPATGPAPPVRRVQTQPSAAMQAGVRAMHGGSSSAGASASASGGSSSNVLAAAVAAAAYPASTRNRAAIQAGSSILSAYGVAGGGSGECGVRDCVCVAVLADMDAWVVERVSGTAMVVKGGLDCLCGVLCVSLVRRGCGVDNCLWGCQARRRRRLLRRRRLDRRDQRLAHPGRQTCYRATRRSRTPNAAADLTRACRTLRRDRTCTSQTRRRRSASAPTS